MLEKKNAVKKFKVYRGYKMEMEYWNDPDYLFDWTEGEFA